ncbi:Protein of unknown function (DUF2959) [Spongiibacter sp. IMCC21906]|jgi:hypothetical protein|uniref:DUF2959 domain-containing protein n=1 Tax=Spongiibacter sp. IMCC21906 TaxID=1620392 RepID=UPI00062DF88D|nr:DUF2959 domain-containing protein [Spongiibacter sp. IMCC21906]AKH68056.1 Protein of unknown function (DUF2959) [Spongiibacter sp. IMCC21906]
MNFIRICTTVLLLGGLIGCQSTYYNAMEKVGVHKRDILVDRVDEAKESQADAQVEFQDALTQFRSVVNFKGGDLEELYDRLNGEYEDSVEAAEEIRDRIDKVESVAEALFDEWQDELELYSNARLRNESKAKLADTQRRYKSLISSMRKAEKSMEPVLSALQDNVLYLKHNLNASAIGALKGELNSIDRDVSSLLNAMNNAIKESDSFIAQLR